MPEMNRRNLLRLAMAPLLTSCRRSDRKLIGVVPKATSHLFFVSIHAGVDRASKDLHIGYQWNGPADETDYARQIQIVDAMTAQQVDALAISATDERALVAPVERAIQAGIPVTIFDSGLDITNYVTFVATDNYAGGCTAARRLGRLVKGQGKVAMVMQKPGGNSTGLRERGFDATMATEFPRIEVAARQFGMGDPERSRAAAENILTAHPGLDGIFASSEASSIGSIQALRSRGLAGKVRLVTFDSSDTHLKAIADGTIDVMLVQDPFRIGYEAVQSLAEHLAGKTPPKRVNLPVREIVRDDLKDPAVQKFLLPPAMKGG